MCADNGETHGQTIDRASRYAHLRRSEATMGGEACDAVTHNIERRDRLTFLRGRERRRWQQRMAPSARRRMSRARASLRIRLPKPAEPPKSPRMSPRPRPVAACAGPGPRPTIPGRHDLLRQARPLNDQARWQHRRCGNVVDSPRVPPARANIAIQARYTAGEAWKADKQLVRH